jgi:hypothetical protein
MVMVIGVKDNFQQYFNYILAVSIIGGSIQDYFPNITRVKYYSARVQLMILFFRMAKLST